ncbi:hypothetical protein DLM45_08875 [Hyphomicrobium methylovorum]|uniref:hypothetical protein n=1 Tax=Hyphomicrobium methylovorum TaxID=84 RepID=UPI0015E7A6FA|nr:hypothetical protein [Hyphomicrobium methylovorum]MBA2126336.1 hypothetical protein [Hyphomicrobium methylovorum]
MNRIFYGMLTAGIIAATAVPANAGGGDFAAGVFGGLATGALIGSARPYYGPPPPAYYYDGPRYYDRYCHWERGRPYWDDYEGVWRRPRIRVCD